MSRTHISAMKLTSLAAALAVGGLTLTACGTEGPVSADGKVSIVVGFYPQEYLATAVGGEDVQVTSLAQPGAEPHDMELSPKQIGSVADADLVIYSDGVQPSLDGAVKENAEETSLDLASVTTLKDGYEELGHDHEEGEEEQGEEEHSDKDPHIWLDPTLMAKMAVAVGDKLAAIDPDNSSTYKQNAQDLQAELTTLDESFKTGLQSCERTTFVTTHNAFGYLADRYGLTQVGIAGLSPDAEPSPKKLAEVADYAKKNDVTTIFYEETVSPKFAKTIAEEVGAKTAVLSPLEVAQDGKDYLSTMESNLVALEAALGCS